MSRASHYLQRQRANGTGNLGIAQWGPMPRNEQVLIMLTEEVLSTLSRVMLRVITTGGLSRLSTPNR